jgi:single-strand DNA-binding protein
MLNRCVLIGRLTKDPELRYLANGTAITTFTLAVDRNRKNAEGEREVDFINCQSWGKQAEAVANNLSKGKLCAVDGALRIESWDKDGERKYKTVINAQDVRFLSPRDSQGQSDFVGGEIDAAEDPDLPF